MRTKTIKIKLRPDRETGAYYAELITDVSLTTVQHTFNSLTRSSDGRIIKEKVRHTKAYNIKRSIKAVFIHIKWLFSSMAEGIKCGVKIGKGSFKGYVDAWEYNDD